MSQKGDHTWDIYIRYHRCPDCGYITENREDFQYRLRKYRKEVACGRCGKTYEVVKETPPPIGPLFGEPQPVEMEWGDSK